MSTKEPRFVSRVLRQTSALRRKLTGPLLAQAVQQAFPTTDAESKSIRERLLSFLGKDATVRFYFIFIFIFLNIKFYFNLN